MRTETIRQDQFENRSYFLFPIRILDEKAFCDRLADRKWIREDAAFETQYILHYAAKMNDPEDKRLSSYARAFDDLPLYMFDARLAERMKALGAAVSGETPRLGGIRLYVFHGGIVFLEFRFDYGGMNLREITEFVYLMRSLRNDESVPYLAYPDGTISLGTAIDRILPETENGAALCFHNPSPVKKQANVFTMINTKDCGCEAPSEEEWARFRYLLAHGYGNRFHEPRKAKESPYEMELEFDAHTVWGGSQEGLVCLTDEPYSFQFAHLCADYRFMYLLLLYQRFASISFIEEFSRPEIKEEQGSLVHENVVYLKTKYSFRVISDDHAFQTIYNSMYRAFEIDHLLEDLEESNDQISDILEKKRQKRERRFEWLIGALSLLTFFSALVDFSDYLDRFTVGKTISSLVSLAATLLIVAAAVILIARKKE